MKCNWEARDSKTLTLTKWALYDAINVYGFTKNDQEPRESSKNLEFQVWYEISEEVLH